jgi:hypothetical protein
VQLQLSSGRSGQLQKSIDAGLSAQLSAWFPWLKLGGDLRAGQATTTSSQEGQSIVPQPVESAARQLVELCLHYLVSQPDRVRFAGRGSPLPELEMIIESPRMIAFVDAPAGTEFLPLAAELNDGRVVTFFDPLIEKLTSEGGTLPVQYRMTHQPRKAGVSPVRRSPSPSRRLSRRLRDANTPSDHRQTPGIGDSRVATSSRRRSSAMS